MTLHKLTQNAYRCLEQAAPIGGAVAMTKAVPSMTFMPRIPRLPHRLCLALVAVLTPPTGQCNSAAAQKTSKLQRETVQTRYHGLSDLSADAGGALWAVPERQRVIVPIELGNPEPSRPVITVDGRFSSKIDFEGLAWIDKNTAAIGTESHVPGRVKDVVFMVSIHGNRARVIKEIVLDYRELFGIKPHPNQGIEGLCFAEPYLAMAIETPAGDKHQRLSPIAIYHRRSGSMSGHFVRLSSSSGKLSALACWRVDAHTLGLIAIERHYEISRLLFFKVSTKRRKRVKGDLRDAVPYDSFVDLAPFFDKVPNLEGIVRRNHTVHLLSDNQSTKITGPTELVTLELQPE